MEQKMNPEVKQKWLEALRSGKYKQTKGLLHRYRGGYCCLGVLCEIAVQDGVIGKPWLDENKEWLYDTFSHTDLPSVVADWAGVNEWGGPFTDEMYDETGGSNLIDLNDGNGKDGKRFSFAEIADVIEKWF